MKRRIAALTALALSLALVAALVVAFLAGRGPGEPRVPEREPGKPIRVEVLNGSGVNGAGLALAEALRSKGFDVVDIRNAERSDLEHTLVMDRVGVPEFARAVASRIGPVVSRREAREDLLLEVTVVLGRDHALRYGQS